MHSTLNEPSAPECYIGLMSGTSLDGVDGVLADFSQGTCHILHAASLPLTFDVRAELLALNHSGADELHRAALAGQALARTYADVVHTLLHHAQLAAHDIRAIGAHGQTVRHCPGSGYTWQLNHPALLAECCGITVVTDFRSRDMAAGGQGAPLVPPFHRYLFAHPGRTIGILNIGGISNLSLLHADGSLQGWDCGPGNMLLDHWCRQHTGQPFDQDGQWGRSGRVHTALLHTLLEEPFLALPPPKSTGRDLFHAAWLEQHLHASAAHCTAQDIQATLAEYTAHICARDFSHHAPDSDTLIVCGGGAFNLYLMERLQALLPTVRVAASSQYGIDPQQVEAAAFAWLACQCINGQPANCPQVTGARGPRILGAIYQCCAQNLALQRLSQKARNA